MKTISTIVVTSSRDVAFGELQKFLLDFEENHAPLRPQLNEEINEFANNPKLVQFLKVGSQSFKLTKQVNSEHLLTLTIDSLAPQSARFQLELLSIAKVPAQSFPFIFETQNFKLKIVSKLAGTLVDVQEDLEKQTQDLLAISEVLKSLAVAV